MAPSTLDPSAWQEPAQTVQDVDLYDQNDYNYDDNSYNYLPDNYTPQLQPAFSFAYHQGPEDPTTATGVPIGDDCDNTTTDYRRSISSRSISSFSDESVYRPSSFIKVYGADDDNDEGDSPPNIRLSQLRRYSQESSGIRSRDSTASRDSFISAASFADAHLRLTTPTPSPQQPARSPPSYNEDVTYGHLPKIVDEDSGRVFPPRPRIPPRGGVSKSDPKYVPPLVAEARARDRERRLAELPYRCPPTTVLPPYSPHTPTPTMSRSEMRRILTTQQGFRILTRTKKYVQDYADLKAERFLTEYYYPEPEPLGLMHTIEKHAYHYSFNDFHWVRTLGTGTFGRVHLVTSVHNQRYFAIKVLQKNKVKELHQIEHTNQERSLLMAAKHAYAASPWRSTADGSPFIVNLWGTWQDGQHLYMVMDYISGGELFSVLRMYGQFPDYVARFYTCEVILALGFLHGLDIIYRDLKPENVMVTPQGHIKLTDFGFAKLVREQTWTLCGTPDYLAPEIILSKPYNKSVDWYSLGVLVYEMMNGSPPFHGLSTPELYNAIIASQPYFPPDIFHPEVAPCVIDFLSRTMTPDLSQRYGNVLDEWGENQRSGRDAAHDIMQDPWFVNVDWVELEACARGYFGPVEKDKSQPAYWPPIIPMYDSWEFDEDKSSMFVQYAENNSVQEYAHATSASEEDKYHFPDF